MSASRTVRAYLGLGANVGDAARTLATAVEALEAIPGSRVHAVSRLYATAPWGDTDQPEFRNAAVSLDVRSDAPDPSAAALDLLGRLKTLERRAGRRGGPRWGPRELDLDLLVFGRHRIDVERPPSARSLDADSDPAKRAKRLQVPHRDLGKRLFVLAPLADLAPRLVPPGWSETVETRRRRVAAAGPPGSVRVVGVWDPAAGSWRPSGRGRASD
jgi:2-amino-4-hydroxy-6-hydroxymethyldihydropteridine diphosphokinase